MPTDWEAIEREYRTGQLSVSEIGRRYEISEGAVRKRAKKYEWARDLTEQVRRAVRARALEADGTSDGTRVKCGDDAALVAAASLRGFDVVTSHRRDLQQIHGLKRILADRLAQHLDGRSPEGPCLGEREAPSDLLEKLSRITARLIPLERQANNLDDGTDETGAVLKIERIERVIIRSPHRDA